MKSISLSILFLVAMGISLYAQDVITLQNGDQIKVKVTEITSSEIKYKRFENLDGPTVVIPRANVFAINYENGTREVINTATTAPPATTPATAASSAPAAQTPVNTSSGAPHEKDFYTGIYLDPLGLFLFGPVLGAELTFKRHLIIDGHLRFHKYGILTGEFLPEGESDSGIGLGVGVKFFTGGRRGGFYVGPTLEYWNRVFTDYYSFTQSSIVVAVNLGYKFQFHSGFYMRTGASLGLIFSSWDDPWTKRTESDTVLYPNMELCFGFAF